MSMYNLCENDHLNEDDAPELKSGILRKAVQLVRVVFVKACGFVVVFGILGSIGWLAGDEIDLLWFLLAFGAVLGVLFGIADAVANAVSARLREMEPESDDHTGQSALMPLAVLCRIIFPPLGLMLSSLFSAHKGSRKRRASFGAATGGLIGTLFVVAITLIAAPQGPNAMTLYDALLAFVPVFMLFGLIAGACSTDW